MQPRTHGCNCDTFICHSSNILLKAGTWQRQAFSRKDKYNPNLMTFQNKVHYRKKHSLREVLLFHNYTFSIHFLSHRHKKPIKKPQHICFCGFLIFICICDKEFLSVTTGSSLITWSISRYRSALCNLYCSA